LKREERASVQRFPDEVSFPVSAFFRFDGTIADLKTRRAGRLELYNPLTIQSVAIAGHPVPLETDLTTPLAYFLSRTDLDGIEYTAFLHADKVQDRTGIYMFEPYQPGKIPVLMVHGLLASPLTWTTMFNDLRADPRIRDRYQFWFYLYPTGNPYLATAADLRQTLARLREELDPRHEDTALDHMVLVGHSMGGLVDKLMTVESSADFWRLVSNKPLDNLKVSPDTRSELQQIFFFDPLPSVERVVFIATPHHGSRLSSPSAKLAGLFIQMPRRLMRTASDVAHNDPAVWSHLKEAHLANSIDLLAPSSPALELLAARPRPPRVHFHSIIGEAFGEGEDSSDGVVPYHSAHLDGVDSEILVSANHLTVHHHPRAVIEVWRILMEHYREVRREEEQRIRPAGGASP
jgi:pimeloyl-ACP methyl ester carboxylesterase